MRIPNHIAIIMDGNRRWAKVNKLQLLKGHEVGTKSVREAVEGCRSLGVNYLTLYTFSTENWNRPKEEVTGLLWLLESQLKEQIESRELEDGDVKFSWVGDVTAFPIKIRELLEELKARTLKNSKLNLVLALNYGGRFEIVEAIKKIPTEQLRTLNQDNFKDFLFRPDLPDVDLMIRTGGDIRISNFLLWQSAYAELIFLEKLWPDFDRKDLAECVEEFCKRERRIGK